MAREFEQLIERNQNWFRGPQPVSEEELDQAEQRLQVSFPQTFRWLLNQCGYWRATGVASLPFIIAKTESLRPAFPRSWVVISTRMSLQRADGAESSHGLIPQEQLVILQTGEERSRDGAGLFFCTTQGKIEKRFSGFSAYVRWNLADQIQRTSLNYQRCPVQNGLPHQPIFIPAADSTQELAKRLWETMILHDAQTHVSGQPLQDVDQIPALSLEETGDEYRGETEPQLIQEDLLEEVLETESASPFPTIQSEQETPYSSPALATSTVPVPTLQLARDIVSRRRNYLQKQHVDVSMLFQRKSSSRSLETFFPEQVPFGELVCVPLSGSSVPVELASWVEAAHLVTTVHSDVNSGSRQWLVFWHNGNTGELSSILEQFPDAIHARTGVDLKQLLAEL